MTDKELAAENVTGSRSWTMPDLAGYAGPDLFSPRDLAGALAALLRDGPPAVPIQFGL